MAVVIGDIELTGMRSKPVDDIRICFHHTGKRQLSVLAMELRLTENALLNTGKQHIPDILGKGFKKADLFSPAISLLEIIFAGTNDLLLQKAVLTVKMLHHLRIQLVCDIALIHHNDIAHAVLAVVRCIVVAKPGDHFEQKRRAFFIVDLRLFAQLIQNYFLGVIAFKINGVSLDALAICHVFKVLD